jgi:hypothetical protein
MAIFIGFARRRRSEKCWNLRRRRRGFNGQTGEEGGELDLGECVVDG